MRPVNINAPEAGIAGASRGWREVRWRNLYCVRRWAAGNFSGSRG